MADGGLVSVIMPVHDSLRTLGQAVRSVVAQGYDEWELLVTDDGSTDGSWEALTELAARDRRIKPERCETAGGPAVARNRAIARATGSWVAFLDSDDLWLPTKLERQVGFARRTGAVLTYGAYYKVAADFAEEAADFRPNDRVVRSGDRLTYRRMLDANYIGCLTAMYDRDALGTRFMPELRKRQDYALWLSILREGHVARGTPEPLALYRQSRAGSVSGDKLSLVRYNWRLYREIERLSVLRSARSLATSTVRSVINGRI